MNTNKKQKKEKVSSVDSRELVLEALLAIGKEQEYSHIVVRNLLQKYNYLEVSEKAFIKRLIEGTLERRIELDYCIDYVSKTPVRKMKPLIRELMRMSTYQILYMDRVPDSAVCNEAVKIAGKHSFSGLKGFVNGVLRNLSRQKESIVYPDETKNRIKALSVRYSMPEWIIQKWDKELGKATTERILAGLLEERPVMMRIREELLKESEAAAKDLLFEELTKQNIEAKQSEYLPYAYQLSNVSDISGLAAFQNGQYTIQDISSMLAVEAAQIMPGDFVIDVCSAPGGKMLLASEKTGKTGQVLARDISDYKLQMMQENKSRMKADNVTLQLWDACEYDESLKEKADVLLADVPCSGLGVIGRKRDIKYRLTEDTIESLVPLQRQILETVQSYVKPGGTLLFSTCTISKAENEETVRWFEENFPFHLENLEKQLPKKLSQGEYGDTISEGYFQFLPGIHGTDGFFVARFVRDN